MSVLAIPPSASRIGLLVASVPPPTDPPVTVAELARISVEQYHQMIACGALTTDDPVELLDGILVTKMPKNPEHVVVCRRVGRILARQVPSGWFVQAQDPITLDTSEPEPDIAIIRGTDDNYLRRHPQASEVALVVEVAESSLSRDQNWKKAIYARNGIPVYWIINLVERTVEVHTDPAGSTAEPDYRQRTVRTAAEAVEVIVAGTVVGSIPVSELIPDVA